MSPRSRSFTEKLSLNLIRSSEIACLSCGLRFLTADSYKGFKWLGILLSWHTGPSHIGPSCLYFGFLIHCNPAYEGIVTFFYWIFLIFECALYLTDLFCLSQYGILLIETDVGNGFSTRILLVGFTLISTMTVAICKGYVSLKCAVGSIMNSAL